MNIHAGKIAVYLLSRSLCILQQNAEIGFAFVITILHFIFFTRPCTGGLIGVNRGKVLRIEELRLEKMRTRILPGTRMRKLDPFAVLVM